MRISNALLIALPALSAVAADDQKPLGDKLRAWFDKATSLIPTSVPSVLPNPLDAGAAKVASVAVNDLTLANWQQTIRPSVPSTKGGPEDWLIYINGGNKTCYGLCGNTTKAWNVSLPSCIIQTVWNEKHMDEEDWMTEHVTNVEHRPLRPSCPLEPPTRHT